MVILLGLMMIVLSIEKLINKNIPGIGYWATCYFSSFIFSFYFLVKPSLSIPDIASVFLFQSFSFITAFLCFAGAREYVGKKVPSTKQLLLIWSFVLIFNYYFTITSPNMGARFIFSSVICAIFFLLAGRTIAYGGIDKFPKRYLFALTCSLHGIFLLARPLFINVDKMPLTASTKHYAISEFILAESFIALVLIALGVLTLANEYMLNQVKKLAELDSLTHVLNRGAFMNMLNKTHHQMQRMKNPLSLLAIDLDHFKTINDTWGHSVGDDALCHFVKVINENLREGDVIGRLGGEEFAICLPDTDEEEALIVAERLRSHLSQSCLKQDNACLPLTASFGVSTLKENEDIKFALKRADSAMYLAKKNGRNRVEVVTD